MDRITVDGREYSLFIEYDSLKRNPSFIEGSGSAKTLTGKQIRELLASSYDYKLRIIPDPSNPLDYDDFYDVISEPVDSHVFEMPYNNEIINFNAAVKSGSDTLDGFENGIALWSGLDLTLEMQKPNFIKVFMPNAIPIEIVPSFIHNLIAATAKLCKTNGSILLNIASSNVLIKAPLLLNELYTSHFITQSSPIIYNLVPLAYNLDVKFILTIDLRHIGVYKGLYFHSDHLMDINTVAMRIGYVKQFTVYSLIPMVGSNTSLMASAKKEIEADYTIEYDLEMAINVLPKNALKMSLLEQIDMNFVYDTIFSLYNIRLLEHSPISFSFEAVSKNINILDVTELQQAFSTVGIWWDELRILHPVAVLGEPEIDDFEVDFESDIIDATANTLVKTQDIEVPDEVVEFTDNTVKAVNITSNIFSESNSGFTSISIRNLSSYSSSEMSSECTVFVKETEIYILADSEILTEDDTSIIVQDLEDTDADFEVPVPEGNALIQSNNWLMPEINTEDSSELLIQQAVEIIQNGTQLIIK